MTSKNGIKILTKLLNLEGIKVTSHRIHVGIGIILQVESLNKESVCPRCGTKSHRLHQNHRYVVKDLPLSGQPSRALSSRARSNTPRINAGA